MTYSAAGFSGGGGGGSTAWADITGKPSTFPPSTHGHEIDDVAGLQAVIDTELTQPQVLARELGA